MKLLYMINDLLHCKDKPLICISLVVIYICFFLACCYVKAWVSPRPIPFRQMSGLLGLFVTLPRWLPSGLTCLKGLCLYIVWCKLDSNSRFCHFHFCAQPLLRKLPKNKEAFHISQAPTETQAVITLLGWSYCILHLCSGILCDIQCKVWFRFGSVVIHMAMPKGNMMHFW